MRMPDRPGDSRMRLWVQGLKRALREGRPDQTVLDSQPVSTEATMCPCTRRREMARGVLVLSLESPERCRVAGLTRRCRA